MMLLGVNIKIDIVTLMVLQGVNIKIDIVTLV